jgi:hypothetical protein
MPTTFEPTAFDRWTPLPYQQAVVRYLKQEEPQVWQWAASAQARDEHAQWVRSELLKGTYRLDADSHPELHERCAQAAARLHLDVPVTLYQAGDGAMNAALYFVPGEAHIVLTGPVHERLQGGELEALLGHELSHYHLWTRDGGDYHTADRVLSAAAADTRAGASHLHTARLYRLYTEMFADRGGCVACGALLPAVGALIKTQTGLAEVSAESYLRQAAEVLERPPGRSAGESHPEAFVRAHGLALWVEGADGADERLAALIEGPLALDTLDLPGQQRLTSLTRRVLAQLLAPRCLRSPALLAQARRFFPDFEAAGAGSSDAALDAEVAASGGTHEYLAWLLLDFAAGDRELDDVPLAAALQLAHRLGIGESFEPLAQRQLGLARRSLTRLKQEAAGLLARAEAEHG